VSERKTIWPLYLGVFTTSMAVLTLEIALTRIFSVSLWYHLAFMVISTALLGFGASGTLLTVRRDLLEKNLERNLTRFAGLTALGVVVAFAVMTRVPLRPVGSAVGQSHAGRASVQTALLVALLLADYVLVVVPFFFAGLTMGSAFSAMAKRISTLYFADLIGAGLGCLVVVGVLWVLPAREWCSLRPGWRRWQPSFFSLWQAAEGGRSPIHASRSTYAATIGAILLFALSPVADRFCRFTSPQQAAVSGQ